MARVDTIRTYSGKDDVVFIHLKAVFFLDCTVYIRKISDIHIENAAAILTVKMIMIYGVPVISLESVRQRYLPDKPPAG